MKRNFIFLQLYIFFVKFAFHTYIWDDFFKKVYCGYVHLYLFYLTIDVFYTYIRLFIFFLCFPYFCQFFKHFMQFVLIVYSPSPIPLKYNIVLSLARFSILCLFSIFFFGGWWLRSPISFRCMAFPWSTGEWKE